MYLYIFLSICHGCVIVPICVFGVFVCIVVPICFGIFVYVIGLHVVQFGNDEFWIGQHVVLLFLLCANYTVHEEKETC